MAATMAPKAREISKRTVSEPNSKLESLAKGCCSQSSIEPAPVAAVAHGTHESAVFGYGTRREMHGLDNLLEESRHERAILELADHLARQNGRAAVERG